MTDTNSIQSGDEAGLVLIQSGKYTITKAAASSFQSDIVSSGLNLQSLVYMYFVDDGNGMSPGEYLSFDSSGNMQKEVLLTFYTGNLRFFLGVYTSALVAQSVSATIYYKIFRLNTR